MTTLRRSAIYERRPSIRFDWLLNPHWTDLAVVVGPNTAWVTDDVEDLMVRRPEVLLGYRVKMALANRDALRGYEVSKLVILASHVYTPDQERALYEMAGLVRSRGGKVERWSVHRVRGIWKVY